MRRRSARAGASLAVPVDERGPRRLDDPEVPEDVGVEVRDAARGERGAEPGVERRAVLGLAEDVDRERYEKPGRKIALVQTTSPER